jgi:hypothetical protein
MKRSIAFILPANAASGVEIEISHVEARRLIREHGLPHKNEEGSSLHDIGTWERRPNGRYFIHFHT